MYNVTRPAKPPRPAKQLTSMRLSPIVKDLLEALADKLSISMAAVLELSIRDMAKREEVKVEEEPQRG